MSRPTSSLLSLATGDLIQSEKHCVVLQPRVTGTHALCNLNGTPRLYYRPQFSLFAFTHIGWNGTKTNRVTELANEIFTQEFVRFYVVFCFSFSCLYSRTQIFLPYYSTWRHSSTIHFNRVHGPTPLVMNSTQKSIL